MEVGAASGCWAAGQPVLTDHPAPGAGAHDAGVGVGDVSDLDPRSVRLVAHVILAIEASGGQAPGEDEYCH